MNKKIFKAYDIRGIYPSEINEQEVQEIALVLRGYFSAKGGPASGGKKGKLILGRDARLSSPSLAGVIKKVLRGSARHQLVDIGVVTTPMFYFLVNELKAVGGIMVTASHTPKEFNGLKVVGRKAQIMSGDDIWEELQKKK